MSTSNTQNQTKEIIRSSPIAQNRDDVGVDVITWKLQNGNLIIQQEMKDFIESLKKKYGMLP